MTYIEQRRVDLVNNGYEPLPCVGKRPAPAGWQAMPIDNIAVANWTAAYSDATNTGIRTKHTPAIDIDVYDDTIAEYIEAALCHRWPAILVRFGKKPKRLVPFRCETPFKKMAVSFKSPDGTIQKVEVLGDGQQFIADGIHPETNIPYEWRDGRNLLSIARDRLPLLDEAKARSCLDEAAMIMRAAGWTQVKANGKAEKTDAPKLRLVEAAPAAPAPAHDPMYGKTALKNECAELAAMSKDSGRNDKLNRAAFNLFQLVHAGELNEAVVRERLFKAAEKCGLVAEDGAAPVRATIESGARAGRQQPRQAPQPVHAEEEADDDLNTSAVEALDMTGVEWLWPGRFALGKFGLIAGLPDMGKGQIAAFIAAAVTANVELPCDEGIASQGNVIWFNAEDGARDTIKPRLVAAGADNKKVYYVNSARICGEDQFFSLVTDLPALRKAIKRIGNVALVIIDPVSAYLGVGKVDGRSATDVRGVLTPLTRMAEELHVAVIGIAHFNKKDEIKSALLRVSDSIAHVAAARHVYAVLDDPEDKDCKLFLKAKNNLARDTKALRYGMGVKVVGYDARLGVDINAPYIVWHPQHVEITANEAMQAAGGHTAKREAREFLLERLEVGPAKASDILDEAKQDGIAERTLKRAKKELGIKSRKTPSKFDGDWFWELPPKRKNAMHP